MAKIRTKGTVLQVDVSSVLTPIAQVTNISGPGLEAETYDATTLDTTDAGKEYEATGYTEPGELSFDIFLDPALTIHQYLLSLLEAPDVVAWKLIFADAGATEWPFNGVFTKLEPTVEMADGLKASCAVKLDGLPTFP